MEGTLTKYAKQNAFVTLTLGPVVASSRIAHRGGQTPVWNQRFTLPMNQDVLTSYGSALQHPALQKSQTVAESPVLVVDCFVEDSKQTVKMGSSYIPLHEVMRAKQPVRAWHHISKHTRYLGEILLEMNYAERHIPLVKPQTMPHINTNIPHVMTDMETTALSFDEVFPESGRSQVLDEMNQSTMEIIDAYASEPAAPLVSAGSPVKSQSVSPRPMMHSPTSAMPRPANENTSPVSPLRVVGPRNLNKKASAFSLSPSVESAALGDRSNRLDERPAPGLRTTRSGMFNLFRSKK